jgi:hypothetical protein
MSNINFDEISKECSKYKTTKLLRALPEFNENSSLRKLVEYETTNFKNFHIHDLKRRQKRDEFFEKIISNINCQETVEKLTSILSVCQVSESYIDDIKTELKSLPLMGMDIQTQCWAVIENALGEGYHLQNLMENHIISAGESNKLLTLNSKNIQSESGDSFSPDSSLDKIVNFLTLTLKMFAYEKKLSVAGDIIIPEQTKVDVPLVAGASAVFYYSLIWNELITCAKSCIFFENEMLIAKTEEIPDRLRKDGVETVVIFNRTIDEFERYDAISNERLSRRISQNMWEALAKYKIEKRICKDVTEWSGTTDNSILLEELPFLVSLMEAISSQDSNDIVLGLSLREWVRGYSVITYLSQKHKNKVIYSKGEISSMLRLGGFSAEKADVFITLITFGDDSRDIYDSPLIRTSNSSYFIFTPAFTSPLISNIILSKFASKQADLSKKGYGFEKDIITLLNDNNLENKSFKFRRGEDEYEYDAIFLLNDKAFILECKNTTLSGGSVTRAYQKKKFIDEATLQVTRLVEGLHSHPEVFKEHFEKDIEDYELIPVIMNNLPLSIPGQINGVYVTDSSAFGRLIRSRYINSGVISHKDVFEISDNKPVTSMWENDVLSASDIINHFNNPIQIQDFIDHKNTKKHLLRVNKSKVFFNVVCETDYDSLSAEQGEYFTQTQSAPQV